MEIGQKIVFDLETWADRDEMVMKETTAVILNFCHDPSTRHESKCIVQVDGQDYGIPFSEIKQILPAYGDQLVLF